MDTIWVVVKKDVQDVQKVENPLRNLQKDVALPEKWVVPDVQQENHPENPQKDALPKNLQKDVVLPEKWVVPDVQLRSLQEDVVDQKNQENPVEIQEKLDVHQIVQLQVSQPNLNYLVK